MVAFPVFCGHERVIIARVVPIHPAIIDRRWL